MTFENALKMVKGIQVVTTKMMITVDAVVYRTFLKENTLLQEISSHIHSIYLALQAQTKWSQIPAVSTT
jgi:hypothetical protein